MHIRGEAAIACGFMAGLATGLLFDGCFDSYINRFCDSDFPRGWPRKTAPARQKADAAHQVPQRGCFKNQGDRHQERQDLSPFWGMQKPSSKCH